MADLGRLMSEQGFGSMDEANAYLRQPMTSVGIPEREPETPLGQAQGVRYQAWDATGRERTKLAQRALAICPDCADAYVLLADEAKSLPEKCTLLEQGVEAGKRALGPEVFEEDAGHFWGMRPYMRALEGLAHCLWALGKREEAIAAAQEMLRLNPDDNQGIRGELISWLLREGDDGQAEALLERYPNGAFVALPWSRVLLAWRRHGPDRQAEAALRKAQEINPHVADFLLGRRKMPRQAPEYVRVGGPEEAALYAAGVSEAWQDTPGALEWLANHARG